MAKTIETVAADDAANRFDDAMSACLYGYTELGAALSCDSQYWKVELQEATIKFSARVFALIEAANQLDSSVEG